MGRKEEVCEKKIISSFLGKNNLNRFSKLVASKKVLFRCGSGMSRLLKKVEFLIANPAIKMSSPRKRNISENKVRHFFLPVFF